jgi:hypothetical protein
MMATTLPVLPRLRGRCRREAATVGAFTARAPSTMLRMVPLPRFAGEDQRFILRAKAA